MAANERVELKLYDEEDFLQNAPSKDSRVGFTPGKATSKPDDQNWPLEFKVKTGVPAVDNSQIEYIHVEKLGRNTINDVEIPNPIVTGTDTVQVVDPAGGVYATNITTRTVTQNNNGNQEKTVGSYGVKP